MALFGLGLAGCIPAEVASSGASPDSGCVDNINDAVRLFNDVLLSLVDNLNDNFNDAQFTYINFYEFGLSNLTALGMHLVIAFSCLC